MTIKDHEPPEEVQEQLYPDWRNARIKFMRDHPATSRALGLTVPPETWAEYVAARTQGERNG